MNVKDMKVGSRYTVTHPSVNAEFQVGDRIRLLDNGDILLQGWGWMEAEHLTEATEGMEIEPDKEWAERRRANLQKQLETFANYYE